MRSALVAGVLSLAGVIPCSPAAAPSHHTTPAEFRLTPMQQLGAQADAVFACIAYNESRNNPSDYNVYSGAGGEYQFLPYIWQAGAAVFGFTEKYAQQAPLWQQQQVAVYYYQKNGGFYEWRGDGCND